MSANATIGFSWGGLLPKVETQAEAFVRDNPAFDGRNIVVGILDTGVSPGAIGLSLCPDGKQKVIDVIDCSGSGDVFMGPLMTASNGELVGVGGRILKLNPTWQNPTGKFRVGLKRALELYPRDLKDRVKDERKKAWMKLQREMELDIRKEMTGPKVDSPELKARLDLLKGYDSDFDEIGPVYDCVVFHDGQHWNAVVDTTESGDMSSLIPMKNYAIEYQYSQFSSIDALVYCVNIFDDGAVLSIVVDAGAHGSHVAGIVSACHPDHPECNGVAPGVQIVSLKIGDSRLGSMETGVGLCRALVEAVKHGCHIINLSYGEAVAWDNQGRFVRLAEELVYKHGIIFVASAGNNGPALSTVGAPGGTSSCAIGVAALATQSLMAEAHSLLKVVPSSNYTWSSVGPSLDGHRGVSVIAPGAAVTSVPTWMLSKNKLMNGTSMSAPNATGCIALLLSAAKQSNIAVSPIRVRRAIENSALKLKDVETLGQGHGLIQVQAAWQHLQQFAADASLDVYIDVTVVNERFERGIYLRQPLEVSRADTFNVKLDPRFHEDTPQDVKVNYELRTCLKSTADWVTCPDKVLLAGVGKTIPLKVDPRALSVGVHTAFVYGYDEDAMDKGPMFEVPVVVVKPEILAPGTLTYSSGVLHLKPAERVRRFIIPPPGCTFIDCVLKDERASGPAPALEGSGDQICEATSEEQMGEDGSGRQVCLHAIQLFRGTPYRDNEKENYFMLTPGSVHASMSFAVTDGVTMELVLARYWSTNGDTSCSYTLTFRGVQVIPSSITLTGGQRVSTPIRLHAALSSVDISPSGKLDKWIAVIKPTTAGKVSTLGERDRLFDGSPIYQMVLEYDVDQTEAGEVTPRWPGLNGILYESEFIAQFFMIFDSKKRLLGTGDAWPKSVKLSKGKHTVRLQVKHDASSMLENLSDMPMQLERPLKSTIWLNIYKSQAQAMTNGTKPNRTLLQSTWMSLLVKEPYQNDIPKNISPGDILIGTMTFLGKPAGATGSGTKPGGHPVRYVVGDTRLGSQASSDSNAGAASKVASVEDGMDTAVRDAKLKFLKGYVGEEESFGKIVGALEVDFPSHLPLFQIILSHAVKLSTKTPSLSSLDRVIAAADKVVSIVNQEELAQALGTNVDKDDSAAVAARKEADTKKAALLEALAAKAIAIAGRLVVLKTSPKPVAVAEVVAASSSSDSETVVPQESVEAVVPEVPVAEEVAVRGDGAAVEAEDEDEAEVDRKQYLSVYKELLRWDDLSAEKHWLLVVTKHKLTSESAFALKRINDLLAAGADNKSKDLPFKDKLLEERDACLQALGWTHILSEARKSARVTNKDYFDPF